MAKPKNRVTVFLAAEFAQVSLALLGKVLERGDQILNEDEREGLTVLKDAIQTAFRLYLRG